MRHIAAVKKELATLPKNNLNQKVLEKKKTLYSLIKSVRKNTHQKNNISSSTSNKKILRIFYVRYADDWILLTNGGREVAEVYVPEKKDCFLL